MPKLIALYIRQCLLGFAVAAVFVGGLFFFNVGNLWYLVTHSDVGLMAAFLLFFLHGIVFAGVQFGIAVMGMAEKDDERSGGGGLREFMAVPVVRDTRRNRPDRR